MLTAIGVFLNEISPGVLRLMSRFLFPFLKGRILKRIVEGRVSFESAEVEFAYLAKTGQVGKTGNPFHYVGTKKAFDNRCPDDLEIEHIFLRTYINGAPWGFIIWQSAQKEYTMPRPEEVCTYPGKFNFPKNDMSLIRFGISIPPFVSLEERLYVSLSGYVSLKSSFGSLTKQISDEVWIDKGRWE
jgi:hypothetical protein